MPWAIRWRSGEDVNRPELVLHERKTRITLIARLSGKTAAETIATMLAVCDLVPQALRNLSPA